MTSSSAIIFVNNDLTSNVQSALVRQLYINEVMTGAEFDARVLVDPNYTNDVHNNGIRVLVIRDFSDGYNRSLADIALFVKAGLASVESNKLGPPSLTLPVDRLYLSEIISGTTPQFAGFIPNPNVQNPILYPINELRENQEIHLMPFGSDTEDEGSENELSLEPGAAEQE